MSDTGIVRIIMNVALHLPRKNSTTIITKMPASSTVSVKELILLFIKSDVSRTISIFTSGGRDALIAGSSSLILSAISTTFDPDCF